MSMHDEQLQLIRYKLQKRVRRLNSADTHLFHAYLKQLMNFIDSEPILASARDEMRAHAGNCKINETVEKIVARTAVTPNSELEAAAVGEQIVLRAICDSPISFLDIGYNYGAGSDYSAANEFAFNTFVEPFYEYLDENLDSRKAVLNVLRRYKHQSEWFRAKQLLELATNDTARGEKLLSADLYEHLFMDGVEFSIEPNSASGIPDFVGEQVGDSKIIADAKIFAPAKSKGRTYLLSGINQVYTYLKDYNEFVGYLVVYKLCKEDINFLLPDQNTVFPMVTINNKTVFVCVIDLGNQVQTASKRGKLKTHDITEDDIFTRVEEIAEGENQ